MATAKWGIDEELMRTAFLLIAAIFAIALLGMSVYTEGAIAGNVPTDGYGVSAQAATVN